MRMLANLMSGFLALLVLISGFSFVGNRYEAERCHIVDVQEFEDTTLITVVREDGHMYDVCYGNDAFARKLAMQGTALVVFYNEDFSKVEDTEILFMGF